MRRQRLGLVFQVLLVLTASLLGIVTNYATGVDHAPFLLKVLQRVSVPAIFVLIVALIITQIVVYRLERPPPPPRIWDPSRTPFPGLDAFTEGEAAVFFGRETQTAELVRRLHAAPDRPLDRFVPLVGASGSGKSSLAQAGVVPRLRERRWTVLPVLVPGSNPLGSLARSLVAFGGAADEVTAVHTLRRSSAGLAKLVAEIRRDNHRFRRMLLVIDQLEELLTLAGDRERALFLDALSEALNRDQRLWILATVRIEFLRDLLDGSAAELFQSPVAIGALRRTQLRQVIEGPAALAGIEFAPGLVDVIVDDAGTSDALPLLAYLLQEVYFTAGPTAAVDEDAYRALGGVGGALARQADHVMAELRASAGIEPILSVLLRFVTIEGHEAIRRRVALAELSDDERATVDAFIDARLLVTDVGNGSAYAQVAHEALFRQWPPLRQEVEARAEQLRQRGELERWASDWERSGRSADYLLTGDRLTLARQWLTVLDEAGQSSDAARALVEASQRRDLAFLHRVSEGIGEYVLANAERYPELSTLLSLAALSDCPPTPAATRALMAALAFNHLSAVLRGHTDAVRNLAWSPDGAYLATASRDGTARIWNATTGASEVVLEGHTGMVEMVAWAPDSARVATASRDGTVRIWDITTAAPLHRLTGAGDVVRCVAWSPDGHVIAAGSRDQIVRLWDAATAEPLGEWRGHTDNILGLDWSPDGTLLASGSHDRTVRLWDTGTGRHVATLDGPDDFVEGVTWHPDGTHLAAASGDQTIRIWDTATHQQTMLIRAHEVRTWNVAWSPDGTRLASSGADHTARIWDPATAQETASLRGHDGDVWGVVWSPDGGRLATASGDGAARIWEVTPAGAERSLLVGHRGPVRGVAAIGHGYGGAARGNGDRIASCSDDATVRTWEMASCRQLAVIGRSEEAVLDMDHNELGLVTCTADGRIRRYSRISRTSDASDRWTAQHGDTVAEAVAVAAGRIASAGRDCRIRLWNAADGRPVGVLTGHQDWVVGLAWSPNELLLASASDDRTARIWDALAGRQVTVLRGHENWVDDVSWSPDGRFVVTGSADQTARIWSVASGDQIAVLTGHDARVKAVAWSPDGTRIATASYDRTVRVWDARGHQELGVIGVHRDKLTSVTWTPDSRHVVTGSFDGTVRVWAAEVDLDALKAAARSRVFRSLTAEERRAHLLPGSDQ